MQTVLIIVATLVISAAVFIPVGSIMRKKTAESKIQSAEKEASRIIENGRIEAENLKKEGLINAKEEVLQLRNELDKEIKERRGDIQVQEKRLIQKEENLEKRALVFENKEKELEKKFADTEAKKTELEEAIKRELDELQRISGLTIDEAKKLLLSELDKEITQEKATILRDNENKLKEEAKKKAQEIVSFAIQKCAADHTSETTVSVVSLPNDEMKGRIIGREGRNIKL